MRHTLRRTGAGLLGSVVLLAALTACGDDDSDSASGSASDGGATQPAESPAVDDGVAWIQSQLTDGVIHNDQYDSDDYSTTVEAAYSLMAVGADQDTVDTMTDAVADGAGAYANPGKDVYAGPTGKLLAFAIDTGNDPSDFGGEDLLGQLEDRTDDSGPTAGRISDVSKYGDYANVLGQTWAVRGLLEADSPEAPAALDFLLQQQCSDGFLRQDFSKPTAKDQSCDGAGAGSSTDATALFVVLLEDQADQDPALADALDAAVAWLVDQQAEDGSFVGSSQLGANSNSTGLSGWALHLAGEDDAAQAAGSWVRAHQLGECDGPLSSETGAIAYDDAALAAAGTKGITVKTQYQWRLATAQALPALLSAPADAEPAACPTK